MFSQKSQDQTILKTPQCVQPLNKLQNRKGEDCLSEKLCELFSRYGGKELFTLFENNFCFNFTLCMTFTDSLLNFSSKFRK
jgi:hypothetical protein